jgi:hypothetical protein
MEKLIKLVPSRIIKEVKKDNLDLDFYVHFDSPRETFRDAIRKLGFLIVVSINKTTYILRYQGGSIVKVVLEEQP